MSRDGFASDCPDGEQHILRCIRCELPATGVGAAVPRAPQLELDTLLLAVQTVVETFKRDETAGYRSRDRQYAIELLERHLEPAVDALAAARALREPLEQLLRYDLWWPGDGMTPAIEPSPEGEYVKRADALAAARSALPPLLVVAASFVPGGWRRQVETAASLSEAVRSGIEASPVAEVAIRPALTNGDDPFALPRVPEEPDLHYLVELGSNPPQWWTGRGDEWTAQVDGTPSEPARCAIRFARRADAERAQGWLIDKTLARGCKVTAHVWVRAARAGAEAPPPTTKNDDQAPRADLRDSLRGQDLPRKTSFGDR